MDGLWLAASLFTCVQVIVGIPAQSMRVIKRRSAGDLSRAALALQMAGFSAWTVAAAAARPINEYILVPNAMGAALSLALLVLAVVFRDRTMNGNVVKHEDPTLR